MKKRLVILGSTGSIGQSALDVVSKNQDRIELVGLSAHSSINLLLKQTEQFHPKYVALSDQAAHDQFKDRSIPKSTQLLPSLTLFEVARFAKS